MPASCDWHERYARVPNAWTAQLVRMDLTSGQLRVALYVMARTWGEHHGGGRPRKGVFGRSHVRIKSCEIADATGFKERYVRRVLADLCELHVLVRHRPARGTMGASIGPNPLLRCAPDAPPDPGSNGHGDVSLDDALAGCSPALADLARRAAERSEKAEA